MQRKNNWVRIVIIIYLVWQVMILLYSFFISSILKEIGNSDQEVSNESIVATQTENEVKDELKDIKLNDVMSDFEYANIINNENLEKEEDSNNQINFNSGFETLGSIQKAVVSYDKVTFVISEENIYITYMFDENDVLEKINYTMSLYDNYMASEIAKEFEAIFPAEDINVYGRRIVINYPISEDLEGITKDELIKEIGKNYSVEYE